MQKLTVGLILLSLVAFGLAVPQYGRRCNFGCARIYRPVCASNGRTYGNRCELRRAICRNPRIRFVHRGRCRKPFPDNCENRACTLQYDPVCGTDGVTYSNSCHLGLAKCQKPYLRMKHKGRCGGRPFI